MNTLFKTVVLTLFLSLSACITATAHSLTLKYLSETGDIKGTVRDENKQPLPFANVIILGTGMGASTADDGSFTIHNVNPGTYDIQATYVQKETVTKTGVLIHQNETTYLDFTLKTHEIGVTILGTREAYIEPILVKSICTFTKIDASLNREMGPVSLNEKITAVCSSCSETADRQLVMRGARAGTVEYIVDGQKVFGNFQVPNEAVQQITILSGGIPAEYGDLTGGVIIIATKDFVSGMRESKVMRRIIIENAQ